MTIVHVYNGHVGQSQMPALSIVEGDILQSPRVRRAMVHNSDLWPGGIVPYTTAAAQATFTPSSPLAWPVARKRLALSMAAFQMLTFVENATHPQLSITAAGPHCYAHVGRPTPGTVHILNLNVNSSTCWEVRTVIHELGHAVGLYHEQSRPDRNTYLDVHSVTPQSPLYRTLDRRNLPYDFASVMHYPLPSIDATLTAAGTARVAAQNMRHTIGYAGGLSPLDVRGLEALYGSSSPPTTTLVPPNHAILLIILGLCLCSLFIIGMAVHRYRSHKYTPLHTQPFL